MSTQQALRSASAPDGGTSDAAVGTTRSSPMSSGAIQSYSVFWVLGLGFLWWPVLLLRATGTHAHLRVRRPDFFPTAICVLLALSLVVSLALGVPLTRAAGAAYNLVVWMALAATTTLALSARQISRGIALLAGVQSVAVLGALAVFPTLAGQPLPLARLLPASLAQDPSFESFTTVRLVVQDYFGEVVLRAAGFFGNATWAGALAALGILVTPAAMAGATSRLRALLLACLAVDGVTLYLSYSRNTWIALAVALLAMALVQITRRGWWYSLTVIAAGVVATAVWAVTSVDFMGLFDEVNSVREGSLDSRTAIYSATWQAVQDLPFPLVGNGVKERVPGLVASLGTHSGYLGILYRGGWLAVALFALWLVTLVVRGWRRSSTLAVGAAVFAIVWFVAEDVDAGHLAPLAIIVAFAAIHECRRADEDSEHGRAAGLAAQ